MRVREEAKVKKNNKRNVPEKRRDTMIGEIEKKNELKKKIRKKRKHRVRK